MRRIGPTRAKETPPDPSQENVHRTFLLPAEIDELQKLGSVRKLGGFTLLDEHLQDRDIFRSRIFGARDLL